MIQISERSDERNAATEPSSAISREMVGERRAHGEEAGELAALLERLDHVVEVDVGQAVAVVGEEHLLVLHVVAHRPQTLADVAPDAGVEQRDAPLLLGIAEQLDLRAEAGDDAVACSVCGL